MWTYTTLTEEEMVADDADHAAEARAMDEELMDSLREHVCPRCHYDVDDDGYCAMCGATAGRA